MYPERLFHARPLTLVASSLLALCVSLAPGALAAAPMELPVRTSSTATLTAPRPSGPQAPDDDASWDGFFQQIHYGHPFVAEAHSVLSKVELGYSKSYSEYDLLEQNEKFDRPVVVLHLGLEIPLYAATLGAEDEWGIAVTLPLSVHVLEDMFGPITAPIIDADYRFGAPWLHAIRHFGGDGFVRNLSLSWLPLFHECTHLGDELTLFRVEQDLPIRRVNVSYEYTELQLTLNDPNGSRDTMHSFRIGATYRLSDRGYGWFSLLEDTELTQPLQIAHSDHRLEYYVSYQLQRSEGFLASRRFVNVISLEARNRVRYGYPTFRKNEAGGWEAKDVKEAMQPGVSLYAGWRFYPRVGDGPGIGAYLHAYGGINPFGQLRNYPGYPFFGVSISYEP